MKLALLIAVAYLMGGIPFGLLIARAKGVDIRSVGSGNIGATNVLRGVGKAAAALTLLGDLLKGTLAVALGMWMGLDAVGQGAMGLAAVLGHNFPVFLGFKGGKGVATSLGVVLIYVPKAGMLTVVLWLVTALVSRYSSLGALVSFTVLPMGIYFLGYGIEKVVFSAIISGMLIVRHKGNIQKLLEGTERKIGGRA